MNILDKIIAHKRTELQQRKAVTLVSTLEKSVFFSRQPLSLKQFLCDEGKTGIIAEFKRKSPSRGVINDQCGCIRDNRRLYKQRGFRFINING